MNYYIAMSQKQEIFTLIGGRVKLYHGRYNPTSDSVWLAAITPKNKKTVLDVGIGTGGVALSVIANDDDVILTGIDTSQEMLEECARNAQLNNRNIELINADISSWRTSKTFDVVMTNPPYFKGTPAKHNAHHNADLDVWVRRCVARVRPRGYFCIIVSADRTAEVITAMNNKCGDIIIIPLYGSKNTAERVLLRGRVGVNGGTKIYKGLPMNFAPVLRDGLTIDDTLITLGWK